jgi:hypothetical protein
MQLLKQSTAVKVVIGPLVDASDGFTPETGVTLGTADSAEVLKHDASAVTDISGLTWAAISGADGLYNLSLTASETDTLGLLTVYVRDNSVCRPVRTEFMVVPANVWDSLFSTDKLQVDISQFNGNAASTFLSGTTALYADVSKINGNASSGFLTGTDNLKADMVKISGSATPADNLEASASGIKIGEVSTGSSTTVVTTNLTEATNDHYNGRTIIFTSGALSEQAATISDYNGATKELTVPAMTEAPANGDDFVII